eukprot:2615642-Pyramimonas_sp.AAC.1
MPDATVFVHTSTDSSWNARDEGGPADSPTETIPFASPADAAVMIAEASSPSGADEPVVETGGRASDGGEDAALDCEGKNDNGE